MRRPAYLTGGRMGGSNFPRQPVSRRRRPVFVPMSGSSSGRAQGYGTSVAISRMQRMRQRSKSYTRSRGRSRTPFQSIPVSAGDGTSNSYYKSVQRFHARARLVKRIGGTQYYTFNASNRISTTTGTQAVTQYSSAVSDQLNDMALTIPGVNNTTELILGRIDNEMMITNMSEATAFVDLYELVPRYITDIAYNPALSMNSGIIDVSGSTATATTLNTTPYMSPIFTTLYKINKKFRVELPQGRTHVHKSYYHVGQNFDRELFNVFGINKYVRNFTKSILLVASGQPINDQTTKANVSTAGVELDVVYKTRFEFHYNNPTNRTFKFSNTLPAITTPFLLDVGSGEPEVLNVA